MRIFAHYNSFPNSRTFNKFVKIISSGVNVHMPLIHQNRCVSSIGVFNNDSTNLIESNLLFRLNNFISKELIPNASLNDRTGQFPWELIRRAHSLGLMNTDVPQEFGGINLTLLQKTAVYEQFGYGDPAFGTTLMISEMATVPLLCRGSKFLKEKYIGLMMKEPTLAAFAVTESEAGSDLANIKLQAIEADDRFILNGQKMWVTNGGHAKWYFVLARTSLKTSSCPASKAFTGFIVDRDSVGLKVGKKEENMGQRCADTRSLILENVEVRRENVVGEIGDGFGLAMIAFNRTRPIVAAMACGVIKRCLDEALRYATTRKTFGKPIIEHQEISSKIARMAISLEATKGLVEKSAKNVDEDLRNSMYYSSIAKVFASESAFAAASDAIQVFGAYGFSSECPVEKLLRDSRVFQIYGGTSEIQRCIITKHLSRISYAGSKI